jgi:hypothetical protein
MDLIKHHEAIFVLAQEEGRVGQLLPVGPVFQVQVQRIGLLGNADGQGGLAHLAWADNRHGGLSAQGGAYGSLDSSRYHYRILSNSWTICKDKICTP